MVIGELCKQVNRAGSALLFASFMVGILLCLLVSAGSAAIGKKSTHPTPPPARLALEASCVPVKAHSRTELAIEVRLVNVGKTEINISRFLGLGGPVRLRFYNTVGKEVNHWGIEGKMGKSNDKADFLLLDTERFYGGQYRLVPGNSKSRYWGHDPVPKELQGVDYYADLYDSQRYYFDPPGRYSLVAEYVNGDDGHFAGLKAWTGTLRSRPVYFMLPPQRR